MYGPPPPNECLDMTINHLMLRFGTLGNVEYLPVPLWPGVVDTFTIPFMGQIKLFSHLNWAQTIRSNHHHHHHVLPSTRISLTLSRHLSLSFIASSYTPYPHRAAVCRFELIILLSLGHEKGSTGVHFLWARPYFFSSVLHIWFV